MTREACPAARKASHESSPNSSARPVAALESVLGGLAFHIAGHELHHHRVVRDRYRLQGPALFKGKLK
jgi:hypothetical protein